MLYATDVDLLFYEPNLAAAAAPVAQTLLSGTGTLVGAQFTLDAGTLPDAGVEPDMIVLLTGQYAGGYAILQVTAPAQMTLSRLAQGLADTPPAPVPIGNGFSVPYAVRTFWPFRHVISRLLDDLLDTARCPILNPQALRHAASMGTLALIYSALSSAADPDGRMLARAGMYQERYQQALRQVVLQRQEPDGVRRRTLNQLSFTRQ